MHLKILICILIFYFYLSQAQTKYINNSDFAKVFDEFNVKGSFLLYDNSNDKFILYDSIRCSQRFIPASTFKIFNSLAGLETGLIPDTNFIFKWDGIKRDVIQWNRDLKLRLAFQYSCVPCYQSLARKIGEERMQNYLIKENYGNMDIGGKIDRFWLTGSLRISQFEQIEFLKKLYFDELGFSKKSMDIVKSIMLEVDKPGYKFGAKTGWSIIEGVDYGWYVGYIIKNKHVYFLAANIECSDRNNEKFGEARKFITEKFLEKLNLLE
jgi:beta-lactamase class D